MAQDGGRDPFVAPFVAPFVQIFEGCVNLDILQWAERSEASPRVGFNGCGAARTQLVYYI